MRNSSEKSRGGLPAGYRSELCAERVHAVGPLGSPTQQVFVACVLRYKPEGETGHQAKERALHAGSLQSG